MANERDQDQGKGAVEQDRPEQKTNVSMSGQLPHRTENTLVKSNDSDFPEPGQNEEHSGELSRGMVTDTQPCENPPRDTVDQDPGARQKRNQGDKKDDDLAA